MAINFGEMSASSDPNSATSTNFSYRNYEEEARVLVLGVLEKSLHSYEQELATTAMGWPTGDTFTVEVAKEAIDALVKVWEVLCEVGVGTCFDPIELGSRRVMEILHRLPPPRGRFALLCRQVQ